MSGIKNNYISIMPKVLECVKRFSIPLHNQVIVGLSGGKDSTGFMFVMRELGYSPVGIIVDLGYPAYNANAIEDGMKMEGHKVIVINVRESSLSALLSVSENHALRVALKCLDNCKEQVPCTSCSAIKKIILAAKARQLDSNGYCLAHHREDFLSTILKDYYIWQYYWKHGEYNANQFSMYIARTHIDLDRLRSLTREHLASTMSVVRETEFAGIFEFRPMAMVPESDLSILANRLPIQIMPSGCSHSLFNRTDGSQLTKREIVHAHLNRCLADDPLLGDQMLDVAFSTLTKSGRCQFNPRSKRATILPGFDR